MILFEDKDIIVCHKPSGIPVQSARIGQKDMVSILNNHLAEIRESGEKSQRNRKEPEMVRVVHRLDQPVEGILVFAKTKKAAAELGKQITEGNMKKMYRAVCCVTEKARSQEWYAQDKAVPGSSYRLVDYLVKDGRTNTSSVTDKGKKDAKRAELSFRILKTAEKDQKRYLLVEINLKTGRHHQIRVQMAHAGLPLYGDQKYNSNWESYQCSLGVSEAGGISESLMKGGGRKVTELALCAASLGFCHPVTGKSMTFEVEPKSEAFYIFAENDL
ncbi:MAG: RluA family pseudouridine synthase [Lachnospiraceae bacterium]|nr:RluA family pseudouridine synthase [Lachnospiraceae bacterium]